MKELISIYTGLYLFFSITSFCFADEVKVQVRFVSDTQYGRFSDAIYFTEAEWADNPNIEAMKQARVDKWVADRKAEAVPHEPTESDLKSIVAEIDQRILSLNKQKEEYTIKIESL